MLCQLAKWLSPKDRLNFALSSKRLFAQIWGNDAIEYLIATYPFERRFQFQLDIMLPNSPRHNHVINSDQSTNATSSPSDRLGRRELAHAYRIVPDRATQQHLNVAISFDGRLQAVLPYDNKLRLINIRTGQIIAIRDVSPMVEFDVWDITKGRREGRTHASGNLYPNATGLDVEVTLEFSFDDSMILLSGRTRVIVYNIRSVGKAVQLQVHAQLRIDEALRQITGHVDYARGVGGAAAISPDGHTVAWVVFSGRPASVYVSFWDIQGERCQYVKEVTYIHPRRWSALGWARVTYAPNGRYCILAVNSAKKMMRMERVGNEFVRKKLCQYTFAVFDTMGDDIYTAIRQRSEWLELSHDVYAAQFGSSIASILDGLQLHAGTDHVYNHDGCDLTRRQQLRLGSIAFNCVHSCPAEATYKALSFGQQTRHPWLVTKQPMFSLHLDMSGQRIHIAKSPHANSIDVLGRKEGPSLDGVCGLFEPQAHEANSNKVNCSNIRRRAFKHIPWRASFATVTSFSSSGRWLAGASLLDGDKCCISVRNLTDGEYFL